MPLANDLRPNSLDEVFGQHHLIGPGKPIRKMKEKDAVQSMLLWGPAGTGKTTIARCLANDTACGFKELNATNSKIADIRKLIEIAKARKKNGTDTILFVDECHRWAKNIQDALLPSAEDGTIIMIGSTTEKPQFAVNAPLLSRLQPFELYHLSHKDMMQALLKVVGYYKSKGTKFKIDKKSALRLINRCSGDIRKLITAMETIVEVLMDDNVVDENLIDVAMPDKYIYFDSKGNEHFDLAEAWQNAIQNSDADSAIYYLAKWLLSGEDPVYIARRILISGAEDAPLNPAAQVAAYNAYISAKELGYPECRINMALATIEIAKSKRGKIACNAISAACQDVLNGEEVMPIHSEGSKHGTDNYTKISKKYVKEWRED